MTKEMKQTMNNQKKPIDKLLFEKQRLKKECQAKERKLNEDLTYIEDHVAGLLLSGVSSLLFPKKKKEQVAVVTNAASTDHITPSSLSLSNYLSIAKSMMPAAWEVARPLLISWGIQRVQSWALGKLFKKKK